MLIKVGGLSYPPTPTPSHMQFMPVKASDDKVNSREMSRMNEKVASMEQPTAKAKNYLSLTQFTIILSILCCFWPYNIFCLFGVYILSKMVMQIASYIME